LPADRRQQSKRGVFVQALIRDLDESDNLSEKITGLGEESFQSEERFYGTVIFARKKRFIIGVLGLKDVQAARNIIKTMFEKL